MTPTTDSIADLSPEEAARFGRAPVSSFREKLADVRKRIAAACAAAGRAR